ncbi:MAG: DUF3800 domain-containing protein [Verrucomicrobiota bacterium JB022]|nr:DUF3800 domain-containing protein [Verrucomicrobiota bacterium JB022]
MMTAERTWVFLDESGNTDLNADKKGESPFYVIAAVVVPESLIHSQRLAALEIKNKQFGGNGMKTSKLKSGNKPRINLILNEMAMGGFKIVILSIDKRNIHKFSGLQYKKSYFKYIYRKIYDLIFRSYENLVIRADEYGSPDFMKGFESYLRSKFSESLWPIYDFQFTNDKDEPLLGIADLAAGNIRRQYDSNSYPPVLEILRKNILQSSWWPYPPVTVEATTESLEQEKHDGIIADHSIRLANIFVSNKEHDSDFEYHVATVEMLINYNLENPNSYLSGPAICENLNEQFRDQKINTDFLRRNIINKLRSNNVIVASSSSGYKIPASQTDINTYINMVRSRVVPYLERLKIAKDEIFRTSHGSLNILEKQEDQLMTHLLAPFESSTPHRPDQPTGR